VGATLSSPRALLVLAIIICSWDLGIWLDFWVIGRGQFGVHLAVAGDGGFLLLDPTFWPTTASARRGIKLDSGQEGVVVRIRCRSTVLRTFPTTRHRPELRPAGRHHHQQRHPSRMAYVLPGECGNGTDPTPIGKVLLEEELVIRNAMKRYRAPQPTPASCGSPG
jgi:hypothetical protein